MSFAGGRYLIFGSRGVGAALSKRLLEAGAKVHVCSKHEESLKKLRDSVSKKPLTTAVCDVMKPGTVAEAVFKAADVLGGSLNGLVYAAGSMPLKAFPKVTRYEMVDHFILNTVGALEAVQTAATELKETKGSVVLFSTLAARRGYINHSIIGPAKGAVEALTVQLAAELAPDVRVNCVAPSLTNTPLASNLISHGLHHALYSSKHPLKRLGEADDLAAVTAFLLSKDASWITGQVINIDGGRSTVSCRDDKETPPRSRGR